MKRAELDRPGRGAHSGAVGEGAGRVKSVGARRDQSAQRQREETGEVEREPTRGTPLPPPPRQISHPKENQHPRHPPSHTAHPPGTLEQGRGGHAEASSRTEDVTAGYSKRTRSERETEERSRESNKNRAEHSTEIKYNDAQETQHRPVCTTPLSHRNSR